MTQIETETQAEPRVIYGEGVDLAIDVDRAQLAQTMQKLGISEQGINNTTTYIDPNNRFLVFGTHYPNKLGRLRFRSNSEIQKAKGDIIRLSTIVRGKPLTQEQINRALVHELEHVAQQDRHDRKLTAGHLAIYGLAAVGAMIGSRYGYPVGSGLVGFGAGHQLGYLLAPHERQARKRAREVQTRAVTHD